MSSSSGSAKFQCPKCLTKIKLSPEQFGTQINCPSCSASLSVPENVAEGDLFDDLFDDDPHTDFEENLNTLSDESELDTGFLEEINASSLGASSESGSPSEKDPLDPSEKQPAFKGNYSESGNNPFEFDENKALQIDGITDDTGAPNAFYFKCPICDSELQVLNDQVGQKIQCSDCHAKIQITRPKPSKKQEAWRKPADVKRNDGEDDLSLEPPIEIPAIEPGFGLEHVKDDLLAPVEVSPQDAAATAASKTEKKRHQQFSQKSPKLKQKPAQRPPKTGQIENNRAPIDTRTLQWNQIFELEWQRDLDLIIRSVLVTIFLALGYTMLDYVWNTFAQTEISWGENLVTCFPAIIGFMVCIAISFWFLSVSFSVLMRSVANGFNRVDEWVGFAPSEWMGSFVVIVVSCWAALLPGVLSGYIMYKLSGLFFLLPMFAAVSAFALMPIFLISSFYNESAFNIFSTDVLQTLSTKSENWIAAYKTFGIALGIFVIGLLLLLIPNILFSFLGASVQVAAVTVFSALIGLHARSIVNHLSQKDI